MATSQILSGFKSLFSPTNKGGDTETVNRDEYTPKMSGSPEDILAKTKKWKNEWDGYIGDPKKGLTKRQKKSEEYWLGEQYASMNADVPLQDNLIFEAVETFLPMATAKNPDPVAISEDAKLEQTVQKALYIQADRLHTKATMKMSVRHWSLFFFGCTKTYWDPKINDFQQTTIHPRNMILDKQGKVDAAGNYFGAYSGEKKRAKWEQLIGMFPDSPHMNDIKKHADDRMSEETEYIEWWTTENVFWTTKDYVLGIEEYPHWNEARETIDEMGQPTMEPGDNQLTRKIIPYTILTVFNLGETPNDVTSLVWQNIPNQDFINKRMKQIDRNADNMNNGLVLSGDHFTKEQAAEAAAHKQKGGTLWVPRGDVNKAYRWDSSPALPEQVFAHLQDSRTELRNIFGIQGSTASGIEKDQTVRGKMLRGQADQSRVGGLISEAIERYVATLYTWQVQMMKVYYTDDRRLLFEGTRGSEGISVSSLLLKGKVQITVKEGSMIPRNPLEERNQAVELYQMGVMSPVTLFKKLGFSNPQEMTKDYVVWMMVQSGALPPTALLQPADQAIQLGEQQVAAQQQAMQQAQMAESQVAQAEAQSMQAASQTEQAQGQTQQQIEMMKAQKEMELMDQKSQLEMMKGQADISQINSNGVFKRAEAQQKLQHNEEKHKVGLMMQKKSATQKPKTLAEKR